MAKNKLEAAWDRYCANVDKYAETEFKRIVLPFLKKHNLSFLAGNGTWYIGNGEEYAAVERMLEELPDWDDVRSTLETEVEGYPANDLGSLMPNFDPNKINPKSARP